MLPEQPVRNEEISIHALREEGDIASGIEYNAQLISIHALREEGDATQSCETRNTVQFLSTPSARRATAKIYEVGNIKKISIHALREEGDWLGAACGGGSRISIHALREEGDLLSFHICKNRIISIHALREEGDSSPATGSKKVWNFYPRPPRGGRPATISS